MPVYLPPVMKKTINIQWAIVLLLTLFITAANAEHLRTDSREHSILKSVIVMQDGDCDDDDGGSE